MNDNRLVALILSGSLLMGTVAAVGVYAGKDAEKIPPPPVKSDGLTRQPHFDYTSDYPDLGVTIRCLHRGGPGILDPAKNPIPGQTFVRTCKSTKYVATSKGGPKA